MTKKINDLELDLNIVSKSIEGHLEQHGRLVEKILDRSQALNVEKKEFNK
jgi:hypothetical protein